MIPITAHRNSLSGIYWFRIGRRGMVFYAPRWPIFFSERYGHTRYLRLFGWRIGVLS